MSGQDVESNLNEQSDASKAKELNGILVSFKDDQLNECVKLALKRKTRVRYKCMDTFSNFLTFGTSGGAIYLYKLKSVTHSSCSLISIIPCDQGSIEVIKFLPNPQNDDLLVAIGTKRGSLVIFQLQDLGLLNTSTLSCDTSGTGGRLEQQAPRICNEIYRAEGFTNNNSIKLIEHDQDLFDSNYRFNKVYICDSTNRLYVLDSTTIYSSRQPLRLFYANHLPSLIFSVNDSEINQINVHKSQLLISTNETTRFFNEQTNQLHTIGTQKRRQGFYGACFFNPNFKPLRILNINSEKHKNNSLTAYSSSNSINELENLLIFVARPNFRMWQVNYERKVMLTHQFEPLLRNSPHLSSQIVELSNEPIEGQESRLESDQIISKLEDSPERTKQQHIQSSYFQKLLPIYSSTLGNLLLSYTAQELFVVDPIGAKVVVWHSFGADGKEIVHICCSENELFVWSRSLVGSEQSAKLPEHQELCVERILLLAPTQLVLELHRLHRYLSIIRFVQMFSTFFRNKMAIPLVALNSVITTEGGLLRNVLLNAWDMFEASLSLEGSPSETNREECKVFKRIVDEIVEESQQLRESLDNLTDSRFFLTMTSENIDRLCSEPYASLVSLEVSIADLHSTHVIHFNQSALNRHKSFANLSRGSLSSINRAGAFQPKLKGPQSTLDLRNGNKSQLAPLNMTNGKESVRNNNNKVIVERLKPVKKLNNKLPEEQARNGTSHCLPENPETRDTNQQQQFFSTKQLREEPRFNDITEENTTTQENKNKNHQDYCTLEDQLDRRRMDGRCANCLWPLKRIHLKHLDSIQHIQLKWLESNLVDKFEENLEQIEHIAFKHGLWRMFLKCLAFKNDLDSYITCCMVLNDVRLLNLEELIKAHGDIEILDCILLKLEQKLQYSSRQNTETNQFCLKCHNSIDNLKPTSDSSCSIEGEEEDDGDIKKFDDHSFELLNLFDLFTLKRYMDVKKVVHHLLKYPELINNSRLTASFYLKAISTFTTNQVPVNKSRYEHLR